MLIAHPRVTDPLHPLHDSIQALLCVAHFSKFAQEGVEACCGPSRSRGRGWPANERGFSLRGAAIGNEGTLDANLNHITDLRLLDMLTWH